jgi:hypothetical protein
MSFQLTGGCGCGAVRFEITSPLVSSTYCHCTRCQRRTGTGSSANARTEPGSFRITRGEDRIRSWKPEGGAEKCFCADCGSALYSRNPDDHADIGVRLGAIDGDPEIRPGAHQFTAYSAVWEAIPNDGLPCHPESARAAP